MTLTRLNQTLTVAALVSLTLLLVGISGSWAQSAPSAPSARTTPAEAKGPYLGVLPSAVPEVLYEHLPTMKRGKGVVVAEVLLGSPADKSRLQRHDILLSYDATPIESCDHFARLLATDKPNRRVRLALLRAGKEQTVEVTLTQGPLLSPEAPRGTAKQTNPSKVSVSASPLADGDMVVTVEYYEDGSSKLKSVTCRGNGPEIDNEISKLPSRVQELARTALERIRALEEKDQAKSREPKSDKYRDKK